MYPHVSACKFVVSSRVSGQRASTCNAAAARLDLQALVIGPGDRMSVKATVKAEKDFKDTLRGFELTLRETTVFRGGPHSTSKKGAPVVKVVHISEQRVPLNAALFGGMQHKAELFVNVPAQHTSATLNTARHIDITYHLVVKALMATTTHVSLDLPVVVSNWPKYVHYIHPTGVLQNRYFADRYPSRR